MDIIFTFLKYIINKERGLAFLLLLLTFSSSVNAQVIFTCGQTVLKGDSIINHSYLDVYNDGASYSIDTWDVISGSSTLTFDPDENTQNADVSGFVTDGVYEVQWINYVSGTDDEHYITIIYVNPEVYNVSVTGNNCALTDVTVTLDGSQDSIIYQLRGEDASGDYTEVIDWEKGDGNSLSFTIPASEADAGRSFKVFATDGSDNCEVEMNGTVFIYDYPDVSSFSSTITTDYCAATDALPITPSVYIEMDGGSPEYTITINDGASDQQVLIKAQNDTTVSLAPVSYSTSYNITAVTDANGCIASNVPYGPVTYNIFNPDTFVVTGDDVCDGSTVTIGLSGSENGIDYELRRDGTSLTSVTGDGNAITFGDYSTLGVYEVYAIDGSAGTCDVQMDGDVIISTPPIDASFLVTGEICPEGEVAIDTSETDVMYELLRDNVPVDTLTGIGDTLTFGAQTVSGTYTIRATKIIGGCSLVLSDQLIVQPQLVVYDLVPNKTTYCASASLSGVNLVLQGSDNDIKYQLKRNGVDTLAVRLGTGDTIAWENVIEGSYIVEASNTGGCSLNMNNNVPIDIAAAPAPTASVSVSGDDRICANSSDSATLSVSLTGIPPYNFDLVNDKNDTVNITSNVDPYTLNVSPTSTTKYWIVNLIDGAYCSPQSSPDSATVYVDPVPSIGFDPSSPEICYGDTITITASGAGTGGTYSWNNGATTDSITVSPPDTTTYSVTVTNTYGCSSVDSVSVIVHPLPTVDFSAPGDVYTYCENDPDVSLTGYPSGGVFNGDGIVNSGGVFSPAVANVSPATNYVTYVYQDSYFCVDSATKEFTITQIPAISFYNLQDSYCSDITRFTFYGNPTNSYGTIKVVGFEGSADKGVWWDDAGDGEGWFDPSVAYSLRGAYTYVFRYIYSIPDGCTDSLDFVVTVNQDLDELVSFDGLPDSGVCQNDTTNYLLQGFLGSDTLHAGNFTGPSSGLVDNGDGTAVFRPIDAGNGTHIITFTYTDSVGCTGEYSDTIVLGTDITIYMDASYCQNDDSLLIGGYPDGGVFSITDPSGNTVSNIPDSTYWFKPTVLTPGTYKVKYEITIDGCDNYDTLDVELYPMPDPSFTFEIDPVTGNEINQYCVLDSSVFLTPAEPGGYFTGTGVSVNEFSPAVAGVGVHQITYTISNAGGCASDSARDISVIAPPVLKIDSLNSSYCSDDKTDTIQASNFGQANYVWSFVSTTNSIGVSPVVDLGNGIATFDPSVGEGRYVVTMQFEDTIQGCASYVDSVVYVYRNYDVNFGGINDTLEFCSNGDSLLLTGSYTDSISAGTAVGWFTGIGINDHGDGTATFYPGSVPGPGYYPVTYYYQNLTTNCLSEKTKIFHVNAAPEQFTVRGGGDFCFSNSPLGVPVELENSENNVDYELLINGLSFTPSSVIVPGDGDSISFGYQTSPGLYSVLATNTLTGCQEMMLDSVRVRENKVVIAVVTDSVSCKYDNDGMAVALASGGTPNYVYSWTDSLGNEVATTDTAYNLVAGRYKVIATDAIGCSDSALVDIFQPDSVLTVNVVNIKDVGCDCSSGGCDGSAEVRVTGGTPEYSILWSTGGSDVIEYNMPPGIHSVTVTDNKGCTAGSSFTINELPPLELVEVDSLHVDNTCNGGSSGEFTVHASGGSGTDYEFSVDSVSWVTDSVFTGLSAGKYKVWVRNPDYLRCAVLGDSVVITEPAPLTLIEDSIKHIDIDCYGNYTGEFGVIASGGSGVYEYSLNGTSWQKPAVFTGLPFGDYSVWVRDTADIGCYAASILDVSITQPDNPLSLSANVIQDVSCFGEEDGVVSLSALGGRGNYVYSADSGANWTALDTITGLSAGKYKFSVMDSAGCQLINADSVYVSQPDTFSVTTYVDSVTCYGVNDGKITVVPDQSGRQLSYSIDGGITWFSNSTGGAYVFQDLTPKTYMVSVRDDATTAGCAYINIDTVNVYQPDAALEIVQDSIKITDVTCNGGKDGGISIYVTGGTGAYSYQWSTREGYPVDVDSVSASLYAGQYNVNVVDERSCSVVDSFVVSQPDAWNIHYTVTDVSEFGGSDGEVLIDTLSGNTPPYTVTWSDGGTGLHRTGLQADTLDFTVEGSLGCTITKSDVIVRQPLELIVDTSVSDVTCYDFNDGTIRVDVSSGNPDIKIKWSGTPYDGGSVLDSVVLIYTGSYTIDNLKAGTYAVDISDSSTALKHFDVIITQPAQLTISHTITGITCNGADDGKISVVLTDTVPGAEISWIGDNGFTDGPLDVTDTNNWSRGSLKPGSYSVTVTNGVCPAVVDSPLVVIEPDEWDVSVDVTDVTKYNGNDGIINVSVISGNTSPYTIDWDDITSGTEPWSRNDLYAGEYKFTITDATGLCEYVDSAVVEQPFELTFDLTSNDATCSGNADGSIGVSITSGNPDYEITLTGGSLTSPVVISSTSLVAHTFDNLTAGTYTVKVKDAVDSLEKAATVNELAPISVEIENYSDVTCYDGSNGMLEVRVDGRTISDDSQIYWTGDSWSYNGTYGTGKLQTGLMAGEYTINVTDTAGCPATPLVYEIKQPVAMSATHTVTNVSVSGNNDGSIKIDNITIDPSRAVDSVVWFKFDGTDYIRTGVTGLDNENIYAGTYQYIIYDDSLCTYVSPDIPVTEPGALVVTVSENDTVCHGANNGVVQVLITSGTAPYTVTLNGTLDDGTTISPVTSDSTNTRFGNLYPGIYNIKVTDSASPSQEYEDTVRVIESPETVVSLTADDIQCYGAQNGKVTITVSGNVDGSSELWQIVDPGDITRYNGKISDQDTITAFAEGIYHVTVTNKDGCIINDSVYVDEPEPWNVYHSFTNISPTGADNGTISIDTISGNHTATGYNIVWSDGLGADERLRTGLPADTFFYVITDAGGCVYTSEDIILTQPDSLKVDVTPDDNGNLCYGDNNGIIKVDVLLGNEPYDVRLQGALYNGIAYDSTVTVTGATGSVLFDELYAGTYRVDVSDNVGNSYTLSDIEITHPDEIIITEDVLDLSCYAADQGAGKVKLLLNRTVEAGDSIVWTGPSGIIKHGAFSDAGMDSVAVYAGGNYSYIFTNANGCLVSGTSYVNEPPAYHIVYTTKDATLAGENDGVISIDTITGNNGEPYVISWGDAPSLDTRIRNDLLASGSPYSFTVTDALGCDTTIYDIVINEPDSLIVEVTPVDVTCTGGNNGQLKIEFLRYNGDISYQVTGSLDDGSSYDTGLTIPASDNILIDTLKAGTYIVNAYDEIGSHYFEDNIRINQPDTLYTSVNVTDISCYDAADGVIAVGLSGRDIDTINTYLMVWNGPEGYYKSGIADTMKYQDNLSAPGIYKISVTDNNGCVSLIETSLYEPDELVINTDEVNDVTCNGGNDGTIKISVSGRPAGYGFRYDWQKWNGTTWADTLLNSTSSIDSLYAGAYRCLVTSLSDNCTAVSDSIVVSENDVLELIPSIKHITTCEGDSTGEITIEVNGGTGPFALDYGDPSDIRTGAGPFVITGLTAGTYSIKVTDANGCFVSDDYIINEPLPLIVDNVAYNIDCTTENTGELYFTVNGGVLDAQNNHQYYIRLAGTNGVSYSLNVINPVDSTYDTPFLNLPEGAYTFEVKDKLSDDPDACAYTLYFDLKHIHITGDITDATCEGVNSGAIDITLDGTSDKYGFVWTSLDGIGYDNSTLDQNGLSAGTYHLLIQDSIRACSVTDSFVVVNRKNLEITGSVKDVTCNGGSDGAITNINIADADVPFNKYEWSGPGVTDPYATEQTNLTKGSYVLSVVDADGCAVDSSFVVNEPEAITFALDTVVEDCSPYQRGINIINLTGGSLGSNADYSFFWTGPGIVNPGDKNQTGLTVGGWYYVTVADGNNCSVTDSIFLPLEVEIVPTVTELKCYGDANGAISIDVKGGSGTFAYNWEKDGSFFSNTKNIEDLTAGIYVIEVTDLGEADGTGACVYYDTIPLLQPDSIEIVGSVKDLTCNGDADGEILLSVSGGTGGYSYLWSGSGTGIVPTAKDQSGLSGGTYTVTVTDDNLCSATEVFTVVEPEAIDFVLDTVDTRCDGTGGVIEVKSLTGGSGYYEYIWAGPGIEDSDQDQPAVTDLIGGDYTVTVRDSMPEHTACYLTRSVSLTTAINLSYSVVPETCDGQGNGAISIEVEGGQPEYTYFWTTSDGTGIVPDDKNQAGLTEGTYELAITDTRSCQIFDTITVVADNVIDVVGSVSDVLCYGENTGAITLTVSGGSGNYSYEWTGTGTGIVTGDKDQTELSVGSYTVKVTDTDLGCEVIKTFDVNGPAAPLVIHTDSIIDVLCKGSSTGAVYTTVTGGTPVYHYQWSGPGTFRDAPFIENVIAGDYVLTVTDSAGCFVISDVLTVTEPDDTLAASVVNVVDVSTNDGSDGEIEISVTGGAGSYNIDWSGVDLDNNPVSVPDNVTHLTGLVAGTYNVIITDGNGCVVDINNIFVNQPGGPLKLIINTQNIIPCQGDNNGVISVNVTGGVLPYTITWYNSDGVQLGQTNESSVVIDSLSAGVYRVDVTDDNGVTVSKNDILIEEPDLLQLYLTIGSNVDCYLGSNGEINVKAVGGAPNNGNYRIEITGPDGYRTSVNDLDSATWKPFSGLLSGVYFVRLIDDSNGDGSFNINDDCFVERAVNIEQPEAKVTLSLDNEICAGESAQIKFVVENWTDIENNPLYVVLSSGDTAVVDETPYLFTVNPLETTQYTITNVSDGSGCDKGYGEGEATVVVYPLPTARIYSDREICVGETATLYVDLTGAAPWTVVWTDGITSTVKSGITATPFSFDVTPRDTTVYKVLSVEDAHCSNTGIDSVVVTVNERAGVTMTGNNDICIGESSDITFSFNAGVAPYEVTLTENGIAKTLTGLIPDGSGNYTYTVTPSDTTEYVLQSVTDAKGCEQTVSGDVLITVRPLPENPGAITGDNLVCQGATGVAYSIAPVNFATNYVWELPAGATLASGGGSTDITVNYADDFTGGFIRVYAENSCAESARSELLINVSPLPDAAGDITGEHNLCQASTGIMYSVPAVENAKAYVWHLPTGFNIVSGDSTSAIVVDLDPVFDSLDGVITVQGINDCGTGVLSDEFDVHVTPLPVAFAGNDEEICADSYVLQADPPSGTETGTWTILKGSGVISDLNDPNAGVTNLSQGDNIFIWEIKVDNTGCSVTDTVVITNNQLTVYASVEERITCDGTVTVNGTAVPAGADNGLWSFVSGNGTIVDATSPTTQVVDLDPDNSTLRWTITKNGCQSYAEVEVVNDQPDQAVISNGDHMDVCSEDVSLTANTPVISGAEGTWSLVSGAGVIDDIKSTTINITGLAKGDNVFRWTIEKNGCSTYDDIVVRNNQLDVFAGGINTLCVDTYQFDATEPPAGVTGRWILLEGEGDIDDGTLFNTTVTNLKQGENKFIWELDQSGCLSRDTVTLINNSPTEAVVGAQIAVCGDTAVLVANKPEIGQGYWTVIEGAGKFDDVNDENTVVRDVKYGLNTYRWTITNEGCSSYDDFYVKNDKVEVYAGKDTSICDRTTVLAGSTPPDGASGEWNIVPGLGEATFYPDNTVSDPRVGGLSYGINVFVWTIESDNNCVSRDTVVITNNSPYPADAGTDQFINGTSTTLNATPAVIGTGTWTLLSGGAVIEDPSYAFTKVTDVRRGPNEFRWTVEHLGCVSTDEVIITNGEVIEANAGLDQTICEDWTYLEGNDPDVGIGEWSVVSGAGKIESPHDQKTKVYDLGPGQNVFRWTLYYTNSSSSDTVIITNNKVTEANAGPDRELCADTFKLEANIPAIGESNWIVISGGGTFDDASDPNTVVRGLSQGANMLKYEISQYGCSSVDSVTIYNNLPTIAEAGVDQTICVDSVELHPNTPTFGVGEWMVDEGAAKFEDNWAKDLAPGVNKLVWVITSANCMSSDTVSITNDQPSEAFAGQDRIVCGDSVTLSANIPQEGTGWWALVDGSGDVLEPDNAYTKVVNLSHGDNRFRWTIEKNNCKSYDDVIISYNMIEALAGRDQVNCADTAILEANLPSPGNGIWGVVGGSGSAVFDDNENPYTIVRELDQGDNLLTWTIDYLGCRSVDTIVVKNNNPTKAFAGDNLSLCENKAKLAANDPTIGSGKWTVITGGATFENDTMYNTNVDSLKFGDNILRWTITSEDGMCVSYDDVEVSFNRIEAYAGPDSMVTCNPDTILEANSALPGIGTWTVVGGGNNQATFEDQNAPNTRVYNLAKGVNMLRWTVSYRGCETYDEMSVINNSPSVSYAGNAQEVCADSTTLDAIDPEIGEGYWAIISGSALIADTSDCKTKITNLSKGDNVLRWIVTNKGCSTYDDVVVTNNLPSEPYAGEDATVCYTHIKLKATPPDFGTGNWSIIEGGGNFSDPLDPFAEVTNLASGTNVFQWTIVEGQCRVSDTIVIFNSAAAVANAGPDVINCVDSVRLDANTPPDGQQGVWSLISGSAQFVDSLYEKTIARNLGSGENRFMWTITNGSCFSQDTVVVVNQVPDQAFAGDGYTICGNETVLNANNPVSGSGSWSVLSGTGEFEDPDSYDTRVTGISFGQNVYKWTITYENSGCSTSDTIIITSNKSYAYAGEDAVVYDPEYKMKAANTNFDARWSVVAGNGVFDDDTYFATWVRELNPGNNTFKWSINVNGCESYDEVTITYKEVPDAGFDVDNQEGCYPLDVVFTNYSVGGSEFYWEFGDGETSTERHPEHTYTEPGEYTVILTVPGPDGQDAVYSKVITVYDHPMADFEVKPRVIYIPGDGARFYDLSQDAVVYLWDFGDGTTSEEVSPVHEYSDEGLYSIQLTVQNEYGCEDVMLRENYVEAKMAGFVAFPNSFMPRPGGGVDNTAVNAIFKPTYRDVDTYTLQIYNRWGQLIFESNDIEKGWDGMYKGQLAPRAVYVWKATGTYISGKEFRMSGSVLLVR